MKGPSAIVVLLVLLLVIIACSFLSNWLEGMNFLAEP